MHQRFARLAQRIALLAGHPVAFSLALLGLLAWAVLGPVFGFSDTWQLVVNTVTTIITFLMVFLIQNAQNRDAKAMQAKLDEIIRAIDGARNQLIGLEQRTEEEVREIRAGIDAEIGAVEEAVVGLIAPPPG